MGYNGEITYVEVLNCAAQLAACRAEQAVAGNEWNMNLKKLKLKNKLL